MLLTADTELFGVMLHVEPWLAVPLTVTFELWADDRLLESVSRELFETTFVPFEPTHQIRAGSVVVQALKCPVDTPSRAVGAVVVGLPG